METIKELILAFIGSLGFSIIFKVPKKYLILSSMGGIVCWAIYFFINSVVGAQIMISSIISTSIVAIYSEICAKIKKVPMPVILIPSLIPLIPGSGLYYTMHNIVANNWENAKAYGIDTLACAIGMAIGMGVIFAVFGIIRQRKYKIK